MSKRYFCDCPRFCKGGKNVCKATFYKHAPFREQNLGRGRQRTPIQSEPHSPGDPVYFEAPYYRWHTFDHGSRQPPRDHLLAGDPSHTSTSLGNHRLGESNTHNGQAIKTRDSESPVVPDPNGTKFINHTSETYGEGKENICPQPWSSSSSSSFASLPSALAQKITLPSPESNTETSSITHASHQALIAAKNRPYTDLYTEYNRLYADYHHLQQEIGHYHFAANFYQSENSNLKNENYRLQHEILRLKQDEQSEQ